MEQLDELQLEVLNNTNLSLIASLKLKCIELAIKEVEVKYKNNTSASHVQIGNEIHDATLAIYSAIGIK